MSPDIFAEFKMIPLRLDSGSDRNDKSPPKTMLRPSLPAAAFAKPAAPFQRHAAPSIGKWAN
jgi:hypothetical protein